MSRAWSSYELDTIERQYVNENNTHFTDLLQYLPHRTAGAILAQLKKTIKDNNILRRNTEFMSMDHPLFTNNKSATNVHMVEEESRGQKVWSYKEIRELLEQLMSSSGVKNLSIRGRTIDSCLCKARNLGKNKYLTDEEKEKVKKAFGKEATAKKAAVIRKEAAKKAASSLAASLLENDIRDANDIREEAAIREADDIRAAAIREAAAIKKANRETAANIRKVAAIREATVIREAANSEAAAIRKEAAKKAASSLAASLLKNDIRKEASANPRRKRKREDSDQDSGQDGGHNKKWSKSNMETLIEWYNRNGSIEEMHVRFPLRSKSSIENIKAKIKNMLLTEKMYKIFDMHGFGDVIPDDQAPDDQAPDDQAPDNQAPDNQAPDEQVSSNYFLDNQAPDDLVSSNYFLDNQAPDDLVPDEQSPDNMDIDFDEDILKSIGEFIDDYGF